MVSNRIIINKKILLLAVVLLSTAANTFAGHLHIKVHIEGMPDSVWIHPTDKVNDGVYYVADNGYFEIDYTVDYPMEVYLDNPCIYRGEKGVQLFFVAVPGESLEISGTVDTGYILSGSEFYKSYNQVYQIFIGSRHRQNAIWRKYDSFWNRDKSEEELAVRRNNELLSEQRDKQESLLRFIKTCSIEDVAAAAIPFLDDSLMRRGESLLSESVRNGRMKHYYLPIIKHIELKKESEARAVRAQSVGRQVDDFSLVDIDGAVCRLADYRGKYVLLDFWGSWCSACVAGFPTLKRYHERYKGKLVVIGVDCKETKDRWQRAVKRLEVPWVHVYNGNTDSTDLMKQYAVSAFPTKILIDPFGRIDKVVVGEEASFYDYLDELLTVIKR